MSRRIDAYNLANVLGQARLKHAASCAPVACPEGSNQQCGVFNACHPVVGRLLPAFCAGRRVASEREVSHPLLPHLVTEGKGWVLCRWLSARTQLRGKAPKS